MAANFGQAGGGDPKDRGQGSDQMVGPIGGHPARLSGGVFLDRPRVHGSIAGEPLIGGSTKIGTHMSDAHVIGLEACQQGCPSGAAPRLFIHGRQQCAVLSECVGCVWISEPVTHGSANGRD